MSHECEGCGEWCYCDIDDMPMEQPSDCRHNCPEWADDDEWDDEGDCLDCGTCDDCIQRAISYTEAPSPPAPPADKEGRR